MSQFLDEDGVSELWSKTKALISNPNLLVNWYFVDPINQRGKTEYTADGWTIDRWYKQNSDGSIEVVNDGIRINAPESSGNSYFIQRIEQPLVGEQVTVSILTADGQLYSLTVVASDGAGEKGAKKFLDGGGYLVAYRYAAGFGIFVRRDAGHDPVTLVAAKLELGSQQTLAHQDASGNWVLNDPPPNKAEELAKCQRYQIVYDGYSFLGFGVPNDSGHTQFAAPLPTTMRLNNVPVFLKNNIIHFFDGFAIYDGSLQDAIAACNAGSAKFSAKFSADSKGKPGYVYLNTGDQLIFDANL